MVWSGSVRGNPPADPISSSSSTAAHIAESTGRTITGRAAGRPAGLSVLKAAQLARAAAQGHILPGHGGRSSGWAGTPQGNSWVRRLTAEVSVTDGRYATTLYLHY